MLKPRIKTVFFSRFRNASFTVGRNETLIIGAYISRAAKRPIELSIDLAGDGGRVLMCYAYNGCDTDVHTLSISVTHRAPRTAAHIFGRGVLSGNASSTVLSTARIEKNAQQADTYFSHHALLLSDAARATATPSLEIETDDVVAGHAASTAPIDQDNLAYVRTRGMSESAATALLVNGFLSHDVDRLPPILTSRFYRSFRLCKSLENT
ncbi:SufD family Fe-S cluster assembly protein [Candidatus Uhrbacteria bacterium]|nr:SufD family Fe-S cluster assembly protein [Candidatus Uhrbacteria bacterium]